MLVALLLLTCALCALAYRFYGRFLERRCEIDSSRPTPAETENDGVDYVPTRASIVFGHHFSSIAGAGPIVGPIVAAAAFGWGPTWLWIIVGAIFVGGVHDFGSTVMSLRSKGRSIVETSRGLVGEFTGKLFLIFVLLALIYVVIVFLDLTAASFISQPEVATASGWFVLTALAFGWAIRTWRIPYGLTVALFVVLTYLGLLVGHAFPALGQSKELWLAVVLLYCYMAAILPVSVLMNPRDFLSATFLYAILVFGVVGLLVHGGEVNLPLFTSFESAQLGYLVPFLFITVACGACSGFHSMVASGTTSKQLKSESNVRPIAYGGMLVEGVLATFSLSCIAVVGGLQGSPVNTFAQGAAVFFADVGIPADYGVTFAMLAVSTFLLTTLDTCARLTRFLVEELFNWRNAWSRYLGTFGLLLIPAFFAFQTFTLKDGSVVPAWQAIWPLFGATNQLLAALALVTFVVFLKSRKIAFGFALVPAVVMIIMPMTALGTMALDAGFDPLLRWIAGGMFLLGFFVIARSSQVVLRGVGALPAPATVAS